MINVNLYIERTFIMPNQSKKRRPDSYDERRIPRGKSRGADNGRKRPGGKKRFNIVLITLEIIAMVFLLGVGYLYSRLGQLNYTSLADTETFADSGPYTNIALFGLDSRNDQLDAGVNSDTMIIASINNTTKEVKLVSVYRDTYLQQASGSYAKANSAYCTGGPQAAVNMLNKNLDLDIKNYASVNFAALISIVNDLGGIEMDLTAEEAYWLDGYICETAESAGVPGNLLANENGGTYKLDGVQATAFCRIRYTSGSDFKRTERQREVISKIVEKFKNANIITINKVINDVFPKISTSLTSNQILGMALHAGSYKLAGTSGFPYNLVDSWYDKNKAVCVVPIGLAQNVTKLHSYLFPDQTYATSDEVNQINNELIKITGINPDKYDLSDEVDTSQSGE